MQPALLFLLVSLTFGLGFLAGYGWRGSGLRARIKARRELERKVRREIANGSYGQ